MKKEFKEIKYQKNFDILIKGNESKVIRKILWLFNILCNKELDIKFQVKNLIIQFINIIYLLFFLCIFQKLLNGIYIFKIYEEKYNIINKKLKKCLMDEIFFILTIF